MAWTIELSVTARLQLKKLGPQRSRQVLDYLDRRIAPSIDPRQFGEPLVGNLSGYWRYRVEDLRVICEIIEDRLLVSVVKVGHRSQVYKDQLP